jgi:hypothetical protein
MKIKPAQILSGIAALAYILCNFLSVFPWILGQNGAPNWSLVTWPIYFVINLAVFSIFTYMFNNKVLRYIAVGVYLLTRLISSLLAMMGLNIFFDGDVPIALIARVVVGLPYWDGYLLLFIIQVFGFLSFILFGIAIILSFLNLPQIQIPTPKYSGNRTVPTITHTPPVQVKKAQSAYADIEVLGDLLKKGLLTQEEFDLKKREILGLDK